jgi:hypothetical protein
MNESLPQFNMNARLVRQWVQNLAQVEILATEGDRAEWAYVAVFWVRLHGLPSELRSQYTGFLRLLKIDPVAQAALPGGVLAHMLAVSRCIEPVRHAFNDDELIYGDYRRYTECHPTQASYGGAHDQRIASSGWSAAFNVASGTTLALAEISATRSPSRKTTSSISSWAPAADGQD